MSTSRSQATQSTPETESAPTSVLLVDDDMAVLKMTRRRLERAGHRVVACLSGREALEQLEQESFDAILSDVSMPGMSGVELMRAVRERDLDVPVLLVTGNPAVESAAAAVAYGALQYLTKPVATGKLEEAVERAAMLGQLARLKRGCTEEATSGVFRVGDRASADATIGKVLQTLWLAFQPIVGSVDHHVFGYEAFMRSRDAGGLTPPAMLRAAERADRLADLGRRVRAKTAQAMTADRHDRVFFLNLHPSDLLDAELYAPNAPLSLVASRVVLEITERAALEGIPFVRGRVQELRRLGYRIGLDDLGGGHSGLNTFVSLEPELCKLDPSLVRGAHESEPKQKIIGSLCSLCHEMGSQVIAEGVESPEERDTLRELGCDFLQGNLYAEAGPAFPEIVTT